MEKASNRWVVAAALVAAAVAAVGVFVVHGWCVQRRLAAEASARQAFLERFGIVSDGRQPFVALPPFLPHGGPQAALGASMFCERKLACTSRRTCAACHMLNAGGTDGLVHGKVVTRPAVNAVFAPFYLHDGSISNMQDLVVRMIEDPDFSGAGPIEKAVLRLASDEQKLARFRAVYPDGLTSTNVVDAIMQYSRTLMTANTPFDAYCGGRANALSPLQKRGMELFRQRKCLSCHDGPALRGISRRRVFLSDGSRSDLGAVLALMPGGELEAEDRAALVSFLKAL